MTSQVLIFSQMTKMLDLLHYYLEERGFDPCRIDGSIPWEERQACFTPRSLNPASDSSCALCWAGLLQAW